jgi:polysaccharide deacetylase family protein (PEP-CTERM system associated)
MNKADELAIGWESSADQASSITNALSIDVEDYFQVSAFAPVIDRARWDDLPCRVERNVDRLLEMLAAHRSRATFFTLGWIAERYPALVRRIAQAGHEVASHGYGHQRANEQTPEEFASDIRRAKRMLEDLIGCEVRGYRAPSFSISAANPWAFDCIAAAGYRYSSSVYPVKHDHYGMPDAPRFPYQARAGLTEVPLATTRVFGRNLPAAGGGFFRLLPYRATRWAIARINRVDRQPAIFYLHPWEIDPQQPRIAASPKARLRHYLNLHRTEPRLARLLGDFRWDRVDRVFGLDHA